MRSETLANRFIFFTSTLLTAYDVDRPRDSTEGQSVHLLALPAELTDGGQTQHECKRSETGLSEGV